MNFSRRNFLKTAGLVCGAAALPASVLELEAAEAAAVNKDDLKHCSGARQKTRCLLRGHSN
jgi:hypothetical protein